MTEDEARNDLNKRGVFKIAPCLWCDKSVPDMIDVHPDQDTAMAVRAALELSGMLPPVQQD